MWQSVLMFNGYFISILGCAMLMVGAYDMYETSSSWSYFINAALVALFIGLALLLSNRTDNRTLSMKQGYLLTATSWVSVCFVSTLPFLFFDGTLNFADVFFEAVSGITGTGATIFADVEKLPRSILLWRSILNVTGGIGVVIFASALLPFLGIGGMQIFQRENSDVNDKFMPKFQYIAQRIIFVYVLLVAACVVSLYFVGMNWFDAVNHGFSAAATGGFSTKNNSIAFYNNPKIEAVIIIFMLLSALPMTFYVLLMQNKSTHSVRSVQVGAFLKTAFFAILALAVWLRFKGIYGSIFEAVRYSAFNVVSVITTCGLSSADYLSWGGFSVIFFAFIMLIGGCSGSTTGSIKIFRWQVLVAFLRQAMILAIEPKRMLVLKIKQFVIDNQIVVSVMIFVTLFFATSAFLILLITLSGVDAATAMAAVMGCITNVGPSFVDSIGPVGNYGLFSPFVKYVLVAAMLLGRLEILTILVIFTRNFWRR